MDYGLLKSGETRNSTNTLAEFLERNPSVQIIIVQWVDICGVVKSRLLPVSSFKSIVSTGGHLNCAPLDTCVPTTAEFIPKIMPWFTAKGKIRPDLYSLRVARHDGSGIGNTAMCYGSVEFQGTDARLNLKRLVEKATEHHGLTFKVGIELEFCFLLPGTLDPAEPAKPGTGNSSYALRSKIWPILNDIIVALAEAGINIEQVVKEYGTSAYEVALPPLPPVEAVDVYVYSMEVIKNIAHKHGVVATFYPTPYDGSTGQKNGQHIHVSATPDEEVGDWDPDAAMAGILSHVPALMALGMAQVDSYDRVGIGKMCTGGILGWGDNNRDMPIRRITRNHWEIRVNDATSNPYAMVAGIIGGALDPKPLKIENASQFTLMYSEDDRNKMGMTKLLPVSLEAALRELESDRAWAISVLGEQYLDWFLALKKREMDVVSKMDVKDRRLHMISFF
ncbi:hypothetical protein FSARC_1134 [Fusarium sarcochroum]|uniref:GS catalytic domain-containing protein n=1 Tax=Fusarium sarcochroum TaxID=1208366 RepID=A0A8H4U9Z6_9HYPO|nr:hypothetical protein FSARC_1134 [Fusarium sarcochroum]